MFRRFAVLAVMTMLGACASLETSVLDPAATLKAPPFVTGALAVPGHFVLNDNRARDTSFYKEISTEDALQWMRKAIETMADAEVCFHDDISSDHQPLVVLNLEKAYVKHMATNISGVVVLSSPDAKGVPVFFRGQIVDVNWWGADSEYTTILNSALVDAIQQWVLTHPAGQ
jgi:hypothetical protein